MMNISSVLSSMDAKTQAAFIQARTEMQRIYLRAVSVFGGVNAMDQSDSTWLDAIDNRLAELALRAGHTVPVVLPTSTAIVAALPPRSAEQLTKEDPTGSDAGNVPRNSDEQALADLALGTRARAAVFPPSDKKAD